MKNIFLFLLLGGLVSFSACSKSDASTTTQEALIGSWNITSMIDLDGDELIELDDPRYTSSAVFTFTNDGKATIVFTNKDLISNTTDQETVTGTFVWENDDTLVVTFPPDAPDETAVVLRGKPAINNDQLNATFDATTMEGNGNLVLVATRL
jgi:hypothetical protein